MVYALAVVACDRGSDDKQEGKPAEVPRHSVAITVKAKESREAVLVSVPDGWTDAAVAEALTPGLSHVLAQCGPGPRPDHALQLTDGKVETVTTTLDDQADGCVVKTLTGLTIDDQAKKPTGALYLRWLAE